MPTDGRVNPGDELPIARVDEQRRLSLVWLIPLVALIAALWLAFDAYQRQGPLVTITFETAEGLEAGKTRVRFKDVDIGLVEAIDLTPDLGQVLVRARLSRQIAPHLNERARFWVVRPRLSGGQVSGLSTLVGGPYIAADLAAGDGRQDEFEGLETPPIVTAAAPGSGFTLLAESLGSLGEGSPVLYRGIEVGRVVDFGLRDDHQVEIQVFVDAPHDAAVDTDTRFWNVSGVGFALDASGVRLSTDSLTSVLRGGIAFGHPRGEPGETRAPAGDTFELFADRTTAMAEHFENRERWQLVFSGSIRGLVAGAPVEFRGIRIGEVVNIALSVDVERRRAEIPVTIAIEPGRLGTAVGVAEDARRDAWNALVDKGLRAQLRSGNLLTGALYVDLDFDPDAAPRAIVWDAPVPRLPTVPNAFDELSELLSTLARLPLDRMGDDLSTSLAALGETMNATNQLLARLDRETASELNATLVQTRETLAELKKTLAPNSPLQAEARRVLKELGSAARSLRIMADYVERHPDALLRGKGEDR